MHLTRPTVTLFPLALSLVIICFSPLLYATDTELWDESGEEASTIDHSAWDRILSTYIQPVVEKDSDVAIHYFRYADVSKTDKKLLKDYIGLLSAIDPRDYIKTEQFAYWVNAYNALTVDLILDNYPVKSITKLGPFYKFGPWDEEVITVAGEVLTLNDIEHKILRPIWQDPRIHYAVNCASYGCPNLYERAFTSENFEMALDLGAKNYVNHSRGADLQGDTLTISKIYKWFSEDFGDSRDEIVDHIRQYADEDLREALDTFSGDIRYEYSWILNEKK